MAYRYSKLIKETQTAKMTEITVGNIFLNDCISSYGIPTTVIKDHGQQFLSKVLKTICVELGISFPIQRPSRRVQRHHCFEPVSLLLGASTRMGQFYNTAHLLVQHTGASNHKAANFCLVVSRQPSTLRTAAQQPMPPEVDRIDFPMAMKIRFIRGAGEVKAIAGKNLWEAQRRYKGDYDENVCFKQTFPPAHHAFVERLSLTTTAAKRLASESYSNFDYADLGRT